VADLSDVTAYLASAAAAAVYPNGSSSPSVAAMDVRIFEGWPIPDQLDLDVAGKVLSGSPPEPLPRTNGPAANVSVYPMAGTGIHVYQISDETYVVTPVSFGLSVAQVGNTITVTGQPHTGEYLTLIADDSFVYSLTGASTTALLASLATAAQVNYPSASSTATTLTIPAGRSLVVRQGGIATLGKVTHRQRQSIMVTVWAPTRVARNALASAIDVAIKANIKVSMPDTSQALIIYSRTNQSDEMQAATVYRRDLIYDVEYATLLQFPGYVVTSMNVTVTAIGAITNANATALI
jgi:hypothetical protein